MDDIQAHYDEVWRRIRGGCRLAGREDDVTLVAVSKTFGSDVVREHLELGQRVFGENRVQEALQKWPELRVDYPDVRLHLIGPLQSNKVRDAVQVFDVIETVDREKIARALADEFQRRRGDDAGFQMPQLFVQVNTGEEPQKAGILPADLDEFVRFCVEDCWLDISGLMCIPPVDAHAGPHFQFLRQAAERLGLRGLSMGMSADYEEAVMLGATHVRVGSKLFGER